MLKKLRTSEFGDLDQVGANGAMNSDIFSKCHEFSRLEFFHCKSADLIPYFKTIDAVNATTAEINGRTHIMIGSNNYLGLTHDPRVQKAGVEAMHKYGTGCTGSRFVNGNLALHEELEAEMAKFLGKDDCLAFSNGFLTNLGAIGCLADEGDVIYSDSENHASIIEGTRVSRAKTIVFKSNDPEDLAHVLKKTRGNFRGAMIVADGIYSMSGGIFNLPAFAKLAKEHQCRIYIDEAHSLGVLGPQGQGAACHFGPNYGADLVMGTFSKSFASLGGFIAGDKKVIEYVRHRGRSFMFSAALPPFSVAVALECLRIVRSEPQHMHRLWENANRMRAHFERMGFNTMGSQSPIIPILIGDHDKAFEFGKELANAGVFATPVVAPAVPENRAIIRTSYMASHTAEELDHVAGLFGAIGRQLGILA